MSLDTKQLKKVEELKSGERTLLQEAHELVVNEEFSDLPEALDFITDQYKAGSIMNMMVGEEEYEQCASLLKEKTKILETLDAELN